MVVSCYFNAISLANQLEFASAQVCNNQSTPRSVCMSAERFPVPLKPNGGCHSIDLTLDEDDIDIDQRCYKKTRICRPSGLIPKLGLQKVPAEVRELLGDAFLGSEDLSISSSPRTVSFIPLTDDNLSWMVLIKKFLVPDKTHFEELWTQHPPNLGKAFLYGKEVMFHRYQQAYGADYAFSGQVATALPLTESGAPQVFHAKKALDHCLHQSGPGLRHRNYGACLVNWYDGGRHSIGAHSDDERGLVKGVPIFILSWGETRLFRQAPKSLSGGKKLDIEVCDGDLLIMGGTCQQTHKHSVPACVARKGGRISLTFRCFVSQQLAADRNA